MPPKKTVEDITKNPWSFVEPVNFETKNETDKDQLPHAGFIEEEYSTDLWTGRLNHNTEFLEDD